MNHQTHPRSIGRLHDRLVRPWTATAVVCVALIATTVGCSTTTGESEDSVTVGYSTFTVANPFFAGVIKGLQDGAADREYELVQANANGDSAQQVSDIQNFINRDVDFILITPADGKAIAPAITQARAANIPVIAIADGVEPQITSTIKMDDVAAGSAGADQIIEFLEKKNGAPVGKVVNIQGLTGTPSAINRSKGFVDRISEFPGIQIVATADGEFSTEVANAKMSGVLQANPQIDAVFCGNDAMAIGATAAIKAAGRLTPVGQPGHIAVVGVDGSKPSIEDIRAGLQDASVSQNPIKMAHESIDMIAKLQAGESIPENVDWPFEVITTTNIDSPEVQEYGIWADEL